MVANKYGWSRVTRVCEFLDPLHQGGTKKFGIKCVFLLTQTVYSGSDKTDDICVF